MEFTVLLVQVGFPENILIAMGCWERVVWKEVGVTVTWDIGWRSPLATSNTFPLNLPENVHTYHQWHVATF